MSFERQKRRLWRQRRTRSRRMVEMVQGEGRGRRQEGCEAAGEVAARRREMARRIWKSILGWDGLAKMAAVTVKWLQGA